MTSIGPRTPRRRWTVVGCLLVAAVIVAAAAVSTTRGDPEPGGPQEAVRAERGPAGSTPPPIQPQAELVSAPTRLIAVGDIACDPRDEDFNGGVGRNGRCRHAAVAHLVRRADPSGILVLGDSQYDEGKIKQYRASYDESWGRFLPKTYPVPGNHEYYTPRASGYFRYFGARASPDGRSYYAFNIGGWLVLGLNSNCDLIRCNRRSAQGRWLEQTLSGWDGDCTLAFMHHPRFSSGPHGDEPMVRPLWRQLVRHSVDAVLAGHDHTYERFSPRDVTGDHNADSGIRSFVSGLGGATRYPFGSREPGSRFRFNRRYGVLELGLAHGSYSWRFLALGGRTFDAGSDTCT